MINTQTEMFALFGNPVIHSKSPAMHNFLYRKYRYNGIYMAFCVSDLQKAVQSITALGIKGVSVTIPFKESIIPFLDWIDPEAKTIGAVNTVVNQEGKLLGFNTDYKAAINPLKSIGIHKKKVCILGAGGAAHAVAYGIHKEGGRICIANRTSGKGKVLAEKFKGESIDLNEVGNMHAEILINTTPVGMFPDTDVMPVPGRCLRKNMTVMDIVYHPLQTLLLKTARSAGCHTIDGLEMFMAQGAAQFELWTGITPEMNDIRQFFNDQDR